MSKVLAVIGGIVICLFCMLLVIPSTFIQNKIDYAVQKVDNATNYETLKQVEDTARSYIASYESDRLMYEQYKDSKSEQERSWAAAAKLRANKTATTYNQFILKNSFVWKDNVPTDIRENLEIIE